MGIFDDVNIFGSSSEIPPALDRADIPDVIHLELRDDMQGFEGQEVAVFGSPIETGENLDYEQGDNPFEAAGNCNLVSTSNFLNLCGIDEANETMITGYAIANGECAYSEYLPPEARGGSNTENMQNILGEFGIDTEVVRPYERGGDIESIAAKIEEGYVGAMGVNAGYLWDSPENIGDGTVNHEVTITGTVRDTQTGELLALTVCDSGTGESCHVVSIEQLEDCYLNVSGADVVFSTEPIRAI